MMFIIVLKKRFWEKRKETRLQESNCLTCVKGSFWQMKCLWQPQRAIKVSIKQWTSFLMSSSHSFSFPFVPPAEQGQYGIPGRSFKLLFLWSDVAIMSTLAFAAVNSSCGQYSVALSANHLVTLVLPSEGSKSGIIDFAAALTTTTKSQDQVEGRFLLNVVIRKSASVLELLSGKDETLLIGWNSFLILDFGSERMGVHYCYKDRLTWRSRWCHWVQPPKWLSCPWGFWQKSAYLSIYLLMIKL